MYTRRIEPKMAYIQFVTVVDYGHFYIVSFPYHKNKLF